MEKRSWRQRLNKLPHYFLIGSLLLFSLAFIDPHILVEKEEKHIPLKSKKMPTEGLAIYFVLDQSGSMNEKIQGKGHTKIHLLKQFTQAFIKGDPSLALKGRVSDMVGLVAFARGVQILSPLTLDHEQVLRQLGKLDVVRKEEQDGTSIGYAVFKTANLIAATRHFAEDLVGNIAKPSYIIKSGLMILVTDGFQSPSPLDQGNHLRNIDLMEAAKYAKQQNVKLYIVNVEPRLANEQEFASYRKIMQQTAEITGGKFYMTDDSLSLDKIYADIDRIEKSTFFSDSDKIPLSQLLHFYNRISFYPYLVGAGMVLLFASALLSGTILRIVP
jgi:Ca-activated chloride channel family protein